MAQDIYEIEEKRDAAVFRFVLSDERGRRVLGVLLSDLGLFRPCETEHVAKQQAAVALLNTLLSVDAGLGIQTVNEMLTRSVEMHRKLELEQDEKEGMQL